MSTTKNWIETVVRRGGGLDIVNEQEGHFPENQQFGGNRRSRQIAKRHWVLRREDGWCSSGSWWDNTTTKHPKGKILKCPKPR